MQVQGQLGEAKESMGSRKGEHRMPCVYMMCNKHFDSRCFRQRPLLNRVLLLDLMLLRIHPPILVALPLHHPRRPPPRRMLQAPTRQQRLTAAVLPLPPRWP